MMRSAFCSVDCILPFIPRSTVFTLRSAQGSTFQNVCRNRQTGLRCADRSCVLVCVLSRATAISNAEKHNAMFWCT
eukprot:11119171-Lingulodinium_polyedra.AAC.1